MEDQTVAVGDKVKPGVDNGMDDEVQTQVLLPVKFEDQPPQATVEVVDIDHESKKSEQDQTQAVNPIEDNDTDQQKEQAREKSELKEAQSVIENTNENEKDLQPVNINEPSKPNEEEAKNTTTTTATTTGESTNSRRSERSKRVTQRFATIEMKTPKVTRRSTSKKLSVIVNGNYQSNQPEGLSINSSGTLQVDKSNLVAESMTKPSLMVDERRLSIARRKNIEENDSNETKDIVVKKRGRVPSTVGKRVDELFILKKIEQYHRDGTWREDAVKIRDKIKHRNLFQCKTCKKSIDSMWKLYHHRQVHLEMNFYLCQFCLVGFNIPISRQLHENTCSRRTNGNSVIQNMLILYRNQFKGKSQLQLPSTSSDQKASQLQLDQSGMSEIKSIPKSKKQQQPKPKIIQKSAPPPVKQTIKRKAIENSGSNLSSENKTNEGLVIFSRRKKRMRTKHIIREGEPEFDVSTYDWTKYAKKVQMPGKPGFKFSCLTCKKTQSSKENLFYHMLIHTNEWPFGCNYCERVFRVPANRDKHEEVKCLNRQSLSMNLNDIEALNGYAPVLKKIKSEIS